MNEKIIDELNIGTRLSIYLTNRHTADKDYLKLVWITEDNRAILLSEMKRSHVQNTLNWCIRKGAGPDERKDGVLYSQWIAFFLARLLDPELE